MPEHRVADDFRDLFSMTTWQPARLQRMLDDYDVTPETLLYRFSELVPRHFDLKVHFLRFNESNGVYRVHKHLNMNELSLPTGFDLREHYCRRWLTVRLLRELSSETAAWPREPSTDPSRIQFSSRGYLYAPNRKTRPMCMNMRMMKTEAPHRCMPRTSQPAKRSFVMFWIDA